MVCDRGIAKRNQGLMRRQVMVLRGFQIRLSAPEIALKASAAAVFRQIFDFNGNIEGRREDEEEEDN